MDTQSLVNLFHILIVVPLFLWVGTQREKVPQAAFWVLLCLGLLVTVYHAQKTYVRYQAGSSLIWVNLIHMLLIGPLLLYIGWHQKDTPRPAYEMLILAGFGALGYHMYELIKYNI